MRRSPVEGEVIGTGSQGRRVASRWVTGRRVTRWTLVASLRWGIRVGGCARRALVKRMGGHRFERFMLGCEG